LRRKNTLAIPIVALLLVVAVGMLLVGSVVNDRVFSAALEERERDKANSIRFATRSIIDAEVRRLSTISRVMDSNDELSAGLARYLRDKRDPGPLKSAMDDLYAKIDTQVLLVTDLEGVVLYRAHEPLKRGDRERVWGFEEAAAGTHIVSASEGPNGWAIRALAPIRSGTRVAGVLILGTRIGDELAGRISRETGARISFANLNGVLTGSTPQERKLRYDPSTIREVLLQSVPIFRMDMAGYRSVQYTPLTVVDETFCLIIDTEIGVVHGMLIRNRVKLVKTAALILVGVLLLGIAVTLPLVRPLKKLEREAREVVREFTGVDLAPELRGNEIDTLAAASQRMVEAIRNHISAREEAEGALRRSEAQLLQAQKMETVGRLAGGIAHDFNNLLTVINGYSDVLMRRLGEADPSRREIGEIHKAGERAAALTRQLLAFSRKQVLEAKTINMNELVSGMCVMVRRLIGDDIELSTAFDRNLRTISADPGQIEQVVLNLAVNARDAMPSGGTITVSTSNVDLAAPEDRDGYILPAGRYARLRVADTGCGMDEDTKARMFEPFFTTKERGKGTGLGLASVYGIVKQSGGHIRANTAPGRGTSFDVYFPVREGVADAPEKHAGTPATPTRTARKGENILLVEDEEMVREMMLEGLRREAYSVLAAGNAQEAISLLERHSRPIDLLLTDLMMPGMNGMELARRLMPLHPGMKVLLMSGYSEEEIGKFVQNAPGTAYLQKPVTPSLISRKVREVLDTRAGG
jgi:signal transduction histidine kinase/CheY-like chemotaxis protein